LGIEISPSTFENDIRMFMKALNDKRGSAVGLREAFVQTELLKTCADLLQKFTERLGRVAPEDRVLDPTKLDSEGEKIRTEFLKKFEEKITGFELPDQGQHIMQFSKDIEKALERRKQYNQTALEGAQTRLFLGSPAVGGIAYFSGGFITGHPLVDTAVCGGITYYVARQHAEDGSVFQVQVLRGVGNDVRGFVVRRVRDIQAMSVAAQTCTPGMFRERARNLAGNAITNGMAIAADASNKNTNNSLSNNLPNNQRP